MKTTVYTLIFLSIISNGYCFLGGFFASQVTGKIAPQNVNVVSDYGHVERMASMAKHLREAKKVVEQTRSIVNQTNRLVEIAGDPKAVIHSMTDLTSVARQLDQIFKTPTTREMRGLVNGSSSLLRSGYQFKDTVGESYLCGKKQKKRQASLYQTYSLFESSYDNFSNLVEADKMIQERETKRQENLIQDLLDAKTQSAVEKIKTSISASIAAQETSHREIMKRKAEMEMEKLALEKEKEKFETARREEEMERLKEARARLIEREKVFEERFNKRVKTTRFIPEKFEIR